jgi:lycopene cyclase domain-containing protein
MESFYYLLINLDSKVNFASTWKAFLPACFITLTGFVIWDVAFTDLGIWGFNPEYLIGIDLLNLPIEEWMFFFCIPYACAFTYASVKVYGPKNPFQSSWKAIAYVLLSICVFLALMNFNNLYTAYTCLLTALFLGFHITIIRRPYFGRLLLTYLFLIVPFLISNGLLTGLCFWEYPVFNWQVNDVADQIVWYNNNENLGLRIFSVPVEDFIYGFLLISMNITLYEYFLKRQYHKAASIA